MEKILKPYTIIPKALYIKRDADRQLANIISDMGRPGYVLVARQMGKTNLLLNAKRELESDQNIFAYIDLSNTFDSPKACFENIVDICLEVNSQAFENARHAILERRKLSQSDPAHKLHLTELRLLLKAIRGKLIIILDEIDALTKTSYSDQVFSLIRSVYFSRVNFPELERLTYILSGVVEPTEIIKDPKISPFNIGQKIFLNDFSFEEFESFVGKVKVKLSRQVKERIYYWTSGNPRITWDLCSEIEDQGKEITTSVVDSIVSRVYLTAFDKPPIDNIRELVRNDREIRDAIIELEYNKGGVISDSIKNKLYLAGIVNYSDNAIKIKNRIISESLSIAWIRSIEEEEKGVLRLADELFSKYQYAEALAYYQKYLKDYDFPKKTSPLKYYNMAVACEKLLDYEKSLEYLDLADTEIEEIPKFIFYVKYVKGLCNFYLERFEDCIKCYEFIVNAEKKDEDYVKALVSLAGAHLRLNVPEHVAKAEKIYRNVVSDVFYHSFSSLKKDEILNEAKSVAFFNLAHISLDSNEQKYFVEQSILHSLPENMPVIYLKLVLAEQEIQRKRELLKGLLDLIRTEGLKPEKFDPEKPLAFSNANTIYILSIFFELDSKNTFQELLEYLLEISYIDSFPPILIDLASYVFRQDKIDTGAQILTRALELREESDHQSAYEIYRLLALFYDTRNKDTKYSEEYIKLFISERLLKISVSDFEIFLAVIVSYIKSKNFSKALNLISELFKIESEVEEPLLQNYLIVCHFGLSAAIQIRDRALGKKFADEILKRADTNLIDTTLLGETGLDIVKQGATEYLRRLHSGSKAKLFNRNERVRVLYRDGRVIETKYKRVQLDVANGQCFVID